MSVMAVVDRVRLVAEQIFDHTDVIKNESQKFFDNFERNERYKEFDGIIRSSHSVAFLNLYLIFVRMA